MIRSFLIAIVVLCNCASVKAQWTEPMPGFEVGEFNLSQPSIVGESKITIIRLDPGQWDLVVEGLSWSPGSKAQSAKQWCKSHELVAAINAGMFAQDRTKHVGYLHSVGITNNEHINSYMSVAAFGPCQGSKVPPFRIFDLDTPGASIEALRGDFINVVQNLRLIKRPGENRWPPQEKMWSEAALGEDKQGRILLIFCRSPYSMHDLNGELLGLGIGVVAAQHLEGGPEAQLYFCVAGMERELFGSYETGFFESDSNAAAWGVPIVLGVRPKRSED